MIKLRNIDRTLPLYSATMQSDRDFVNNKHTTAAERWFMRNMRYYPIHHLQSYMRDAANGSKPHNTFSSEDRYIFFSLRNTSTMHEKTGSYRSEGASMFFYGENHSFNMGDLWFTPKAEQHGDASLLRFHKQYNASDSGSRREEYLMRPIVVSPNNLTKRHATYRAEDYSSPLMARRAKLIDACLKRYDTIDSIPQSWRRMIDNDSKISEQFALFHNAIKRNGELVLQSYTRELTPKSILDHAARMLDVNEYSDIKHIHFIREMSPDIRTPAMFMFDILAGNSIIFV